MRNSPLSKRLDFKVNTTVDLTFTLNENFQRELTTRWFFKVKMGPFIWKTNIGAIEGPNTCEWFLKKKLADGRSR